MDIKVGDKLKLKKQHPCGCDVFKVLRIGMEFRIICDKCGRDLFLPRSKVEKAVKAILPPEEGSDDDA